MVQKASTPWSTRTVAEGGTDSPVGDLVPIPDKITPVVNTGFISLAGKYRGIPSDDLQFTFQDPDQAVGAGATIFIDPFNMLNHDMVILALLDSSGNDIDARVVFVTPTTLLGPYNNPIFSATGVQAVRWQTNKNTTNGTFYDMAADTSIALADGWQFIKISGLRGTLSTIQITNNEGADAGTISTAYLRLV